MNERREMGEWFGPRAAALRVVADPGHTPSKAYEGDAGFDLYCKGGWVVKPGQFVDIDCGVAVQLPAGYWGMLTGRSSTLRKRGLMVSQGVIDNGYRGPLFAGVWNLTDHDVGVAEGERLAQLIVLPIWAGRIWSVDQLEVHDRGTQGFGSSGL